MQEFRLPGDEIYLAVDFNKCIETMTTKRSARLQVQTYMRLEQQLWHIELLAPGVIALKNCRTKCYLAAFKSQFCLRQEGDINFSAEVDTSEIKVGAEEQHTIDLSALWIISQRSDSKVLL